MNKKVYPTGFVFNPKRQPGYESRRHGVNFNRYFGDAQFGLQAQKGEPEMSVELPQGLKSFQLVQVFPSRRLLRVK